MTRPRDLAFEALADVTSTDWKVGRGVLNSALRDIRTQSPRLIGVELANEIVYRAKLYREVFGDVALTPNALAKHWLRVYQEGHRPSAGGTNLSPRPSDCQTCEGVRFVVVSTRPAPQTQWMTERGFKANGEIEEYAPCPDCSSHIDTSHRGPDGRMIRCPDPEKVREMMRS